MTLNVAGFAGGPITDDDFGSILDSLGAFAGVQSGYAVTQPDTSTRTVSIAAGDAQAHGIRIRNDAAISQALSAPGSGVAWYLLALRRNWASKSVSLVVLTGPTLGSTALPSLPPIAFPAGLTSDAGNTTSDQPLTWVAVSSATSTVAIFDARLTANRIGGLFVPNLYILQAYANSVGFASGPSVIGVLQHDAVTLSDAGTGGNTLQYSLWQRRSGAGQSVVWHSVNTLRGDDNAPTALRTLLAGLPNVVLVIGETRFRRTSDSTTFLYVGPGGTHAGVLGNDSTSSWQAWDKPSALLATPQISNVTLGGGTRAMLWGISGGRFWMSLQWTWGASPSATANVEQILTLPSQVLDSTAIGNGRVTSGGSTDTNTHDLKLQPVGGAAWGTPTSSARIRARYVSATAANVRERNLGTAYTPAQGDQMLLDLNAPSALVA